MSGIPCSEMSKEVWDESPEAQNCAMNFVCWPGLEPFPAGLSMAVVSAENGTGAMALLAQGEWCSFTWGLSL